MADTLKRLAGPAALSTSAATIYTVPASTTTTIRHLHVCNETAGAVLLTVSIGIDGAGTRLFKAKSIAANDVLDWPCLVVLTAAEVVQAFADTATAVTIILSGVETL
jgi:hypothetical protein